jgi:hypothetical protein
MFSYLSIWFFKRNFSSTNLFALSENFCILVSSSNNSKIKKLGWKPKISINKGLELTLNWYIAKN